jgi:hypothetical protein
MYDGGKKKMTGEKTGADEHKLIFDSLRELLKLKK